mgnify:CR=1 FL=1
MAGQQQCQRNEQNALPNQRDQQRAGRLSDALKERRRGHVQPIQEKCHHVEPETVLRTVQIEGIIGDKQHGELARKQQIDQPPQRGDRQGDSHRHAVGFPHQNYSR